MKKLWVNWLQMLWITFKEKLISLLLLNSLKLDISEKAFHKYQRILMLLSCGEMAENVFKGFFKHLFWDVFFSSYVKSRKKKIK